jgi:hypothetical protein
MTKCSESVCSNICVLYRPLPLRVWRCCARSCAHRLRQRTKVTISRFVSIRVFFRNLNILPRQAPCPWWAYRWHSRLFRKSVRIIYLYMSCLCNNMCASSTPKSKLHSLADTAKISATSVKEVPLTIEVLLLFHKSIRNAHAYPILSRSQHSHISTESQPTLLLHSNLRDFLTSLHLYRLLQSHHQDRYLGRRAIFRCRLPGTPIWITLHLPGI